MKYDKFYGKVWAAGDSFILTIPKSIIKYQDIKLGEYIIVTVKKEVKENDKKIPNTRI